LIVFERKKLDLDWGSKVCEMPQKRKERFVMEKAEWYDPV
jgi:hypothetical protein